MPRRRQRRRERRSRIKFLLLAACLFGVVIVWEALFKPVKDINRFTVESGQTFDAVLLQISVQHQVWVPTILKVYQRLFIHASLKAGEHRFPRPTTIRQMLHMLASGDSLVRNKIILLEGWNYAKFAAALAKQADVKQTLAGLNAQEIAQKIDANLVSIEGWLAPNTYFFASPVTDLEIFRVLYAKQQEILMQAWQNRAKNLPYLTSREALIMASIVEKETSKHEERARIAAVFVNRLRIGMKLQTDPTVIYGMGEHYEGNITRTDLVRDTPYNTYVHYGLPPTPIAMPSKASIEAVLHPANTHELYFVADGKGGHIFSQTYEAHAAAVQQLVVRSTGAL